MQQLRLLPLILCFACQFANAQQQYSLSPQQQDSISRYDPEGAYWLGIGKKHVPADSVKMDSAVALIPALAQYNQRFRLWDSVQNEIDLKGITVHYNSLDTNKEQTAIISSSVYANKKNIASQKVKHKERNLVEEENVQVLDEVVVGYQRQKPGDVTISYARLKNEVFKDLPTNNVADLIGGGRMSGVDVIKSSGEAGASSQITIRGVTSLFQSQPLYVIDGVVQPHDSYATKASDPGNNINPHDIASIDVLKDAAGAAIYGAAASGGVIIITTKSGVGSNKPYAETILKDQEDVDYMTDIENVPDSTMYAEYLQLEKNNTHIGFYLDMALHFYEKGLTQYTNEMMDKATGLTEPDVPSQTALAFVFEYIKNYDGAIAVYKNLCKDFPADLKFVRDLAWAYYEKGNYDTAVSILYNGTISTAYPVDIPTIKMKDIMLAEMNMIIALHKDEVKTGYIPPAIIKPIPAEMRVLVECNNYDLADMSVEQPWKRKLDGDRSISKDGARLENAGEDSSLTEFQVKHINKNGYTITVPYFNNGWDPQSPTIVKITKIKNFGKPDQSIETDIATLDHQYGQIVVDEIGDASLADH